MHVTTEPDGDPVRRDGGWVITARVTARMTDAEYQQMDGLRYEAYPWSRFRVRVRRRPSPNDGDEDEWYYEVRDHQGETGSARFRPGEAPVVHYGARHLWDLAVADGLYWLKEARRAAGLEEVRAWLQTRQATE
jgi:hypothetical protein